MLKDPRTRSVPLDGAPLLVLKDPFGQFQICNSGEIWVSVDRPTANRIVRKMTGAMAAMVRAKWKAEAKRAEAREYRQAALNVLMEEREADRRNRALWRRLRVKPDLRPSQPARQQDHGPRRGAGGATKSGWLAGASPLPRYSGPIIDRMGRAGIFFRVSYYGKASKPGVGRRATNYIFAGAYKDATGQVYFESNIAGTPEEAMAGLEMIELLNREAQANGKALFHIIANVPYQLERLEGGEERMFEIARRFAKHQYGSRNLPYAIALHRPSEDGDQRNWHIHVIASTRPMVRKGAYEWDVGEMLRTEIDNAAAFAKMRALYAEVQTEIAREAGLNMVYTALSNAERGLPNAPQKHLGGERTAKVRRGERDPVNERNWAIQLAGETALLEEQARRAEQAVAAELTLLERALKPWAPAMPEVAPAVRLSAVALSERAPLLDPLPRLSRIDTLLPRLSVPAAINAVSNLKPPARVLDVLPRLSRQRPQLAPIDHPAIPLTPARVVQGARDYGAQNAMRLSMTIEARIMAVRPQISGIGRTCGPVPSVVVPVAQTVPTIAVSVTPARAAAMQIARSKLPPLRISVATPVPVSMPVTVATATRSEGNSVALNNVRRAAHLHLHDAVTFVPVPLAVGSAGVAISARKGRTLPVMVFQLATRQYGHADAELRQLLHAAEQRRAALDKRKREKIARRASKLGEALTRKPTDSDPSPSAIHSLSPAAGEGASLVNDTIKTPPAVMARMGGADAAPGKVGQRDEPASAGPLTPAVSATERRDLLALAAQRRKSRTATWLAAQTHEARQAVCERSADAPAPEQGAGVRPPVPGRARDNGPER